MKTVRIVVLAVVLLLLLAAESYAAGLLVPRDGRAAIAVKSHRVTVVVSDGMARTKVRQTFVNPYSTPLEAIYLFPLPEGAALTGVAMETGGQRLEGLLAERKRARRIYDDIVRRKKDPALVEQIGRDMFRLSVFPVIPGEDTVVEIEYVQHLPLVGGEFRYVYPLASGGKAAVTKQDLTLLVRVHSSLPLGDVTSSVEGMQVVRKSAAEAVASFEETGASLDRDLVVTAQVAVEKPTLTVSTWRGEKGEGVFLAIVTPPAVRDDQLIPRDVILVVDTSGSMRGRKIEQARASALFLLDHLRPADRVNVVRFSSDVQPFADEPVPATPENLEALRAFVKTFEARGGTAIADALTNAVHGEKAEGRVRTVVFLTDGRPTVGEKDPVALVTIAKKALEKGLRIFPFGVGEDLDAGLLRGIAEASRGRAELFRPGGEVESRLTAFLLRTSAPVLSDLEFAVDGIAIHDVFPRPLPDVYLGEQVAIAGRYPGGGECDVTVSANVGNRRASLTTVGDFRAEAGGDPAVRDLFAKAKLDWLENQLRLRLGLADDAYYAALDRGAYGTEGEIVEEIVATSLECGVQCPYTSFLVLLPEDRARLDPRDANAIAEALERVRKVRGEVAMTGGGDDDPDAPAKAPPADPASPAAPAVVGGSSSGAGPRTPPAGSSGGGGESGGSTGGGSLGAPGGMSSGGKRAISRGWSSWWTLNGPDLLDRRAGVRAEVPVLDVAESAVAKVLDRPGLRSGDRLAAERVRELLSGTPPAARRHSYLTTLSDASASGTDRAIAALAVGRDPAGAPDAVPLLLFALRAPGTPPEARAACALSLGSLGDASAVSALAGLLKLGRIGDRKMTDPEKIWILHALDRIGDPAAWDAVRRSMQSGPPQVVRAALTAFGSVSARAGPEKLAATGRLLARALTDPRDPYAADAAALALGRLGAAVGSGKFLETTVDLLLRSLALRGRGARIPFAGMALGLLGTGADPLPPEVRERVGDALIAALRDRRNESAEPEAFAIALGLLGDDRPETAEVLTGILRDKGQPRALRGGAAIGLGLLGAKGARDHVLAILKDERERDDLREDAATAAGLFGGDDMTEALVAVLSNASDLPALREEAARALARMGRMEALPALLAAMEEQGPDGLRVPAVAGALDRLLTGTPAIRGTPWDELPPELRNLLRH